MAGVAAVGLYVPRWFVIASEYPKRLGADIEEVAVPGFDEDVVTMAVAAGERAIDAAQVQAVDTLVFASSGTLAGARIVAEALGVKPEAARDVIGGLEAGETAMAGAIYEASEDDVSVLVVASDAHAGGAAAVAILVTSRASQPWTPGASESSLLRRVGDPGAATAFVRFLESLGASKVGGADVIERALDGRVRVSHEQSQAFLHQRPAPAGTEYSQGAYVSMPAYLGEAKARYRLVGEECAKCGRLHFPPRESCLACGARAWKERALKGTGTVYAYTIIGKGAAPSEFMEQQLATGDYATAVVELDDGLRITAMLADVEPASVKIGMRVRMVFRRLYAQEGVVRYGFKFAPA